MLRIVSGWKPIVVSLLIGTMLSVSGCAKFKQSGEAAKGRWAVGAPLAASPQTASIPITVPAYRICTDCVLIGKEGQAIHNAGDSIRGVVERVIVFEDKVQFVGWATDVVDDLPVTEILIFADDELVHLGTVDQDRYDVAKELKQAGAFRSGFSIVLAMDLFEKEGMEKRLVRVFAISVAGGAIELSIREQQ